MMSHCPTRSHCANPCGVLHSAHAPLRRWRVMPRRYAASAGGIRDRGSVAPLPAPAPLAHPPGAGIPAIVAPLRARDPKESSRRGSPPRRIETLQWRESCKTSSAPKRHRPQWLANRLPCSARPLVLTSSTTAEPGTKTRRLPGSRKRSTSWPARSHRTARNSPTNAKACSGAS